MKDAFRSRVSQTLGCQWVPNGGAGLPGKKERFTGMKLTRLFGAGAVVLAMSGPAFAWPSTSSSGTAVPYGFGECMTRAARSLAVDGWSNIHQINEISMYGGREPSAAVIYCTEGGHYVMIFVASSAGDASFSERAHDRLRFEMTR